MTALLLRKEGSCVCCEKRAAAAKGGLLHWKEACSAATDMAILQLRSTLHELSGTIAALSSASAENTTLTQRLSEAEEQVCQKDT